MLVPAVLALGRTAAHDVVAFCVAVKSVPVVSAFNLQHVAGLQGLTDLLRSPTRLSDVPVLLTAAVMDGQARAAIPVNLSFELVALLKEFRMGVAFLNSFKPLGALQESFSMVAAACIDKMPDCITKYDVDRPLVADYAAEFASKWCGDGFTREQMRAVIL